MLSLSACTSVAEVLALVSRAAADQPDRHAWIRGVGLRTEALAEQRPPTARELSDASGGRRVMLRSFDHHALVVSSAILALAGITAETPDPPGGVIRRDGREPTGTLLEHACDPVWRALPAPTDAQYTAHVRAALQDLAAHGFTEVHDMFARERLIRTLHTLEAAGELATQVELYATPEHFDAVLALTRAHEHRGSLVRFGGLKLFADGTLNSRTAFMLTPYTDPLPGSPCGTPLLSDSDLSAALTRARAAGTRVAVHAIGDAAVRRVLDAIESESRDASPSRRRAATAQPHRIEHAQFVDESDIPRFASLGVIASPQPCHLLTDIEAINRFTPHRAARAFPLRDLVDAYSSASLDPAEWILLGSDAPVVPPNPHDNIQSATHRRRPDSPPSATIAPEQSIDEPTAWRFMRAQPRAHATG